nr:hypothetical protein [Tanacetum cinerariifolium]
MIPEPGDANREVTVTETFHVQTDDKLTEKELKQIEAEVDELKDERLEKTQDPLALMANSNNPYAFLAPHQDQSSFNQNYLQQPMPNIKDITDLTTAMNMALALMAKAFKLNYSTTTNNNQRISSNPRNRQIAQLGMNIGQDRQMQMVGGNGNQNRNGNLVAAQEVNANCILMANLQQASTSEEYDLMAAAADLDEIEEVDANCILMANLQQASTLGTQTDSAPVYDTDGSAENDNNVISKDTSVEQGGETLEQHPANFEETRALYKSLYQNLAIEVEKVNSVNRKLKETNADLTTELVRFKNQTRCFEISQENMTNLKGVTNSLFIRNNVFLK